MFQVHLFGRKSVISFNSSSISISISNNNNNNNNNNVVTLSTTTIPTIIFEATVTSF
jgi:hypothetical protein